MGSRPLSWDRDCQASSDLQQNEPGGEVPPVWDHAAANVG
jgi:hypothetical protein